MFIDERIRLIVSHGQIWSSSAYYGNSKTEISSKQYEVLCDSSISHEKKCYEWEPDSDGNVPKNAIVAGITSDTPIYIAKAAVNGEMCIGKVHDGHKCAHLPWGGSEHEVQQYEVLVFKKK
uniref:DUF3421 domain-containing protein n=1 Tax=Trichobilharzia regenti TaxID=157069 RepID=A0AA85JIC6_TRIRE|nr:unnamed protein product [Trichobilharzia regenti]